MKPFLNLLNQIVMLSQEKFLAALSIIQESHGTVITINQVPPGGIVSQATLLVIHTCSASTVNKLVEAGYSLYPDKDRGIIVHHFKS